MQFDRGLIENHARTKGSTGPFLVLLSGAANLAPSGENMSLRIYAAGSGPFLDALKSALAGQQIDEAPASLLSLSLGEKACLLVSASDPRRPEAHELAGAGLPVVELFDHEDEIPSGPASDPPAAHLRNPREIWLAIRLSLLSSRTKTLASSLSGPWAHDARGALGIARMALQLLTISAGAEPSSPVRKVESGVTRMGFTLERLPDQVALALDLPLGPPPPSIFRDLGVYLTHLKQIHPHRPIQLEGESAMSTTASAAFIPTAAGFVDLALHLSAARGSLRIAFDAARGLEFECECPERRAPWDFEGTLQAEDILSRFAAQVPFRLLEGARRALRFGSPFSIEFSSGSFVARASASRAADSRG